MSAEQRDHHHHPCAKCEWVSKTLWYPGAPVIPIAASVEACRHVAVEHPDLFETGDPDEPTAADVLAMSDDELTARMRMTMRMMFGQDEQPFIQGGQN